MAKNKPTRKKYNPNRYQDKKQMNWGELRTMDMKLGSIERIIASLGPALSSKQLRPFFDDPKELSLSILIMQNDIQRFRARRKAISMLYEADQGVINSEEDLGRLLMITSFYVELQNKVEFILQPSFLQVTEHIDRAQHNESEWIKSNKEQTAQVVA